MSSKRYLSLLPLVAGMLCMRGVNAQIPSDSIADSQSFSQAIDVYLNSAVGHERLYSGPLYTGYDHHTQGHPFFMTDTLLPGSAFYDGVLFPELRLSYDLVKDVVVMRDERQGITFQLEPEKLPYFTLARRRFVYLAADSSSADHPPPGFYEELYHGKAVALVRHEKVNRQLGKAEDNASVYLQFDHYYLQIGGRYYSVHSDRGLLDAFGSPKALVQHFMKTSHLSYRRDAENALKKTAEYYSQVKN